jgi:hypothetical protein
VTARPIRPWRTIRIRQSIAMKSNSSKLLLCSSFFLLSAFSLQAGVESVLKLDLRCYYQKKISTSDSQVKGSVDVVRLDSKQLLKLLSKQAGLRYPAGSQLTIDTSGKVLITGSKGGTVADVSRFFKAEVNHDDAILDGKYNRDTFEEKSVNYFPISFTINLPAFKGTVSGVAIENFSVSKPDKFDIQHISGRTTSNVSGQGQLAGKVAYFDGKMTLSGKDAVIVND